MNALIAALIIVESGGNDFAKGDYVGEGKNRHPTALGCLQIHKPVVDDVNRVYHTHYSWSQMTNRTYSIDVCQKYLKLYAPNKSAEIQAKVWNCGTKNVRSKKAQIYWTKVKKELH